MNRPETALEEERTISDVAESSSVPSADPGAAIDAEAASRVVVIRPASRIPHLHIEELWHYRELLWTLVWRDVAVRYKQTFLGVAWAILVPAFTALVYVIVFGKFANFPAGDDAVPQSGRCRRPADAVLRLCPQPGKPEPAVEPSARHEGVLPPDAAPARRSVRAARRFRRRPARARSSSSGSTTRGRPAGRP